VSAPPHPSWMRSSAAVDLAQLIGRIRPVVRSEFAGAADHAGARRWARRHGFYLAADGDGYFVLGRQGMAVRRTLRLDARAGRHVIALGLLLGYPRCCSIAAGRRLEEEIDRWAESISRRPFVGLFRLIDPAGYRAGKARISHVPCSARCCASLRMALRLGSPLFRRGLTSPFEQPARQRRCRPLGAGDRCRSRS
jgi:hypothetical protein